MLLTCLRLKLFERTNTCGLRVNITEWQTVVMAAVIDHPRHVVNCVPYGLHVDEIRLYVQSIVQKSAGEHRVDCRRFDQHRKR